MYDVNNMYSIKSVRFRTIAIDFNIQRTVHRDIFL